MQKRFILAFIPLLFVACTPEPEGGDNETVPDEDLAALTALPYVAWTEDTDPTLLGVTHFDEESAWAGVNLYTNDVNEAYLMDMSGRRLHTWSLPETYEHCEHFEVLAGGDALVVCATQGLVRLGWKSNIVWSNPLPVHHDVAVLPDGTFMAPFGEPVRAFRGRRVAFDGIAHFSADGEILSRWSTFDHLDELHPYHPESRLDQVWSGKTPEKPFDYYHLNTIEVLPETPLGAGDERFRAGNLLICLRNAQLILVLDQDSMQVTWSWGPGELSFPHMPTLLPSGNMLIYDNGVAKKYSRIIELDPASNRIVWTYEEPDGPDRFFSKRRGSAQRLPNGNTLVCESEKGHVFEITPDGERVWQFWNPDLRGKKRKRIYRFMRAPADELRDLLRGSDRPSATQ